MITNETELAIYPSTKSISYIPSNSLDVALMNIRQGEFWGVFNELFKKTKYYKDDFYHALCCVERFLFEFGFHEEGDLQFNYKLFKFLRNDFCKTEETTPIFAKKTTQTRWIRKKLVNNFNKSTTSFTTSEITEGRNRNLITSYYERNDVRVSIEIRKICGRRIPYLSVLVTDESGKHEPICITDTIDCRKVYEKVGLCWTGKPGYIKFRQVPTVDSSSGNVLNSPLRTQEVINYYFKEHQERIFYSPRGKYILNYICSLIYITIQQADAVTGERLRPMLGIENDKIVLLWEK